MRWLSRSREPLSHCQVAVPTHADFAITPFLRGQKLHNVVVVVAFMYARQDNVAFGLPCTSTVWTLRSVEAEDQAHT